MVVETPPHLPLNLREKLGLKDAPGLERLRDLPSEEESLFGEVDENVADDLTQVHTTDHLLIPERTRGLGCLCQVTRKITSLWSHSHSRFLSAPKGHHHSHMPALWCPRRLKEGPGRTREPSTLPS
jgi:hypothetical protein